jgi:hypothetical protein
MPKSREKEEHGISRSKKNNMTEIIFTENYKKQETLI